MIQFKVIAWAPKGEVWVWIHTAEVWAPAVVVWSLAFDLREDPSVP